MTSGFISGASGKVYAIAANTGSDASGGLATPVAPITGSMALAGPLLFVPTSAGLLAVDTGSGSKIWTGRGRSRLEWRWRRVVSTSARATGT